METLLNEQLLLEDLLDDIADAQQKKVDLTKLADDGDDDADAYADDRQEERPFDLSHWKYIF